MCRSAAKLRRLSAPWSVWDTQKLVRALEREDVSSVHAVRLQSWLAHHVWCSGWEEVEWSKLKMPSRGRRIVETEFLVRSTSVESVETSRGTSKLIVRLSDGLRVETVVIRHGTLRSRRVTVCVSSQIGCQMQCGFCATGTMGLLGDLTAGEIVEQFVAASRLERCRNVVAMGMGEPLNNYDNVLSACRTLLDDKLFALAAGRVTISTVGVVDKIKALGVDEPRVSLALSLHAPTQTTRESIMPAARAYKLDKVLAAVDEYVALKLEKKPALLKSSSPLVMLEYILLGGVNDSDDDARTLGELVRRTPRAMINLIPYNPVPGLPYERPQPDRVKAFQKVLQDTSRLLVCVRITMGDDVAAACGQLVKAKQTKAAVPDIEDSPFGGGGVTTPKRRRKTTATHQVRKAQLDWMFLLLIVAFFVAAAAAVVHAHERGRQRRIV